MAKTANPALVIGLGGTGQWVLTYLKKNLIDTYGEVPQTVRMLSFDTTGIASEAEIEKGEAEERAQVGNITLGEGEFIYLGGNIKSICEDIRDGERKHPHIRSWLQAKYYLRAHDDDAYDISKGAGRRRQFGRMAVFYDLAIGSPQITGKIEQALSDIKSARERTMPVEIYVVCSLAGGTGAGMVIDVAHLARVMAKKVQLDCAVRGFLVLQNTFAPVARIDDVQPSAFAAMRELDRFMLVFDRDYPIYYSSSTQKSDLQTIYRSKLFDNCYLLDARRLTKPLDGTPPKLGVFPSVADCMSVLLDPETGETFSTHYKNVNDRLAKAQAQEGKALYSSLGTYTYVLPIEDIIERNILKLARDLMEKRLVTIDYDETTKTMALNSSKVIEFKVDPRTEAKDFLQMERSVSNVPNIIFCQNVARQLNLALDQQHVINDFAALGLELLAWLKPIEDDDTMVQAGNRIDTVLQTSLIAEIPNAKITGEDFQTAADRIDRDIRETRRKLLGSEEQSGRKTPGELLVGLTDYRKRNLARFRRLLSEKLLLLLNGATDDPIDAKTGKLPFTREFLERLTKGLEEFEDFLREVNKTRAADGLLAQAREFALQTRQYMFNDVHATGLIDKWKGTAVKAEDAYIGTEDYLFSLEREEVLYQEVLQFTRQLKGIVQEAKEQVDQWLNYLVLGGPPESGEKGVFRVLLEKQAELTRRRENQAKTAVHDYLTDDSYEDELYESRIDDGRLGQIMRQFDWRLVGDESFDLRLFYSVPRRRVGDEEEPEFKKKSPRRDVTATDANVQLLLDHLRPTFLDIRNETIADRMSESLTAARAAKDLLDNAGALVSYADNDQPIAEKHNFVCANQGNQVNYFTSLGSQLKKSAPNDKDNQVTGQSNRHRCTILSTVDLIFNEQTKPYAAAADAYRKHNGDRKLLHNFPAEVNATEFEQRLLLPPIREAYRLLSPELVGLLEDREMANRFVMSLVYGLIKEEKEVQEEGSDAGSRKNQYVLRLDTGSRRQRQVESWMVRLTHPSTEPRLLDAMKNFVFVHLDPQNGTRAIKDISPDINVLIPPENVDKALYQREDSFVSGQEKVVEAFANSLKDPAVANLLKPEGDLKLTSAFRLLLTQNERPLRRGEMDTVHQEIANLVDNNHDCYDVEFNAELKQCFSAFINSYQGGQQIIAGDYDRLINLLERFIEDKVLLWRGKRLPDIERREKGPEDQLTRDMGAIIHLVLWDEIGRIERLRNQAS
jgi:hypothetical protein